MNDDVASLGRLEQWLLTAVSAPGGLEQGLERARANVGDVPGAGDLGAIILPSKRVSALERLRIYSNMYYSRLVEILSEDFPAVTTALGPSADATYRDYLDRHPSTHQRLTPLGRHLARYFAEERPDLADAPILASLAHLEHTRELVFEGERGSLLDPATLAAMTPDAWPRARLHFIPASALFRSEWPVNDYLDAVLNGDAVALPERAVQRILLWRKDFKVRRLVVSPAQWGILDALRGGSSLMEAIGAGFDTAESDPDGAPEAPDAIAGALGDWFRTWAEAGVFGALTVDD